MFCNCTKCLKITGTDMNHIFKKIWNKSLGRMVVVSEHAKSAGKTDNTTGTQSNSLSNIHDDEQGKNFVFSFKPLVLKSLVLSIAAITGVNVWADDNYAHTSTDTALGSAFGTEHNTTNNGTTLTSVAGITVTSTGLNIDDITSFTVGGVTTTKAPDLAKVAAFINAAKKGGNIAVGLNSSAVGVINTASGWTSSALGYKNTASNLHSSALGWSSSSVGLGNLTTQFASSAFGFSNAAVAQSSTAMGSGISGGVSSRLRTLEEKVENGKLVSVNGVAVTATSNTTATITHVNGVAVDEYQKSQFLNILRQGNVAAGQYSSAMGVRNLATGVDSSAFGYGNDATANQSSVFCSYSQATAQGATAIGNNSLAGRANTISVGKAGAEKQITNVAAGTADTDAINKKQLTDAIAAIPTAVATDNYAHTSIDTALGSARGTPHATTTTAGKITAVGGITVTTDPATAGTSIDDINSFTVGGVITTKAADPAKVTAFINAAKKGGNIAVGNYNSAVGTANIAVGNYNSAMGTANIASGIASSAVGYSNTVVSSTTQLNM